MVCSSAFEAPQSLDGGQTSAEVPTQCRTPGQGPPGPPLVFLVSSRRGVAIPTRVWGSTGAAVGCRACDLGPLRGDSHGVSANIGPWHATHTSGEMHANAYVRFRPCVACSGAYREPRTLDDGWTSAAS